MPSPFNSPGEDHPQAKPTREHVRNFIELDYALYAYIRDTHMLTMPPFKKGWLAYQSWIPARAAVKLVSDPRYAKLSHARSNRYRMLCALFQRRGISSVEAHTLIETIMSEYTK
jgi:hypothetical protein